MTAINNSSCGQLHRRSSPAEEMVRVQPTRGCSYSGTMPQILQLQYMESSEESFLLSVSETTECLCIVGEKKVIGVLCSEIMSLCLVVALGCFFCRSDLHRFLNCQFHPLWLSLVWLWILMAQSRPCLQWAQSKKNLQKLSKKKKMSALLWLHKCRSTFLKVSEQAEHGFFLCTKALLR